MAYLGNAPARSFISFERQVFTIVNSQTAYALSHSVTNENDIRLVVNNVVQEPGSGKAYTATGTALTLSAALTNGTDEMYCVFLGRATATSAPGAGSIGTAQLADLNVTSGKIANDAVTLAKMASGTDGNIISYDASGNPVAVATGNDGQVLTSAGAGAPPVFETLPVGGITEADQWRLTTSFTGDATPIASNLERVDSSGWGKIGTGMSQSSGIFTFPSTGIWFVKFRLSVNYNGNNLYATAAIQVTTNNSSYANISSGEQGITNASDNVYSNTLVETLIDCTNTSNVKVRFAVDNENASANNNGSSSVSYTNMMFIRLGDT